MVGDADGHGIADELLSNCDQAMINRALTVRSS